MLAKKSAEDNVACGRAPQGIALAEVMGQPNCAVSSSLESPTNHEAKTSATSSGA